MIRAKHTTGIMDMGSEYNSLSANVKKRSRLGHSGVDGSTILNWISKTQGIRVRTGFNGLRIATSSKLL
jgi:hypothetical protein